MLSGCSRNVLLLLRSVKILNTNWHPFDSPKASEHWDEAWLTESGDL